MCSSRATKFVAHRFTILRFEIVVLKKLPHIRSHDLRRSLPFPLDDLINQVIGDDKPQSGGHDADAGKLLTANRVVRLALLNRVSGVLPSFTSLLTSPTAARR
jgi:hypothetical protein